MADPMAAGGLPAAPAAGAGAAGASSTASLLGFADEPELDDVKDEAVQIAPAGGRKRMKLTHGHFFDNEAGFKKLLSRFSGIKFKGKGRELEDLKVLIGHYGQWFKELYPSTEKLEDLVWMARNVLQEKDKGLGDGGPSDPRERLHMLRYEYKTAKRKAADSAKWASEASAQLSEEARQRIAANRQRALEIKQKKAAEAAAAAPAPAADGAARAAAPPEGGLDMETLWAIEERRQEAQARKRTREEAAFCRDDEEDVFGFGGGFDADEPVNIREVPKAAQPPRAVPDEEEDVFGFGGGMGEDTPPRQSPPPAAPPPAHAEAARALAPGGGLPPEVQRSIEERRQRARELKQQRQQAAAAPQAPPAAQPQPPQGDAWHFEEEEGPAHFQDEDDVFGFGGGMD